MVEWPKLESDPSDDYEEGFAAGERSIIQRLDPARIAKAVLNAPRQRGWGNLDERERQDTIAAVETVMKRMEAGL